MLRSCLLLCASLSPCTAFGAEPPEPEALKKKIAEGKLELAKMERDLAKLNADAPAVVGQWVWAGELKMRVTGAELRDVMARDVEGGTYKTGEKELAVKVEVASLSKTRKVSYTAFGGSLKMTDDRGNKYEPSVNPRQSGSGGGFSGSSQKMTKDFDPGDPSFADVLYVQSPKAGAKELRITLKGFQHESEQEHHFRLASWSAEPYPPAGTAEAIKVLEKAAQLSDDKGDREKLMASAGVLKRASEGPPQITAADREREKRAEELAGQLAAKREEVLKMQADLTAAERKPKE